MKKIRTNSKAALYTLDSKGNQVAVDSFYAPLEKDCFNFIDCGSNGPGIQFKSDDYGLVVIPLDKLYASLKDNGYLEFVDPAPATVFGSANIISSGFRVTWTPSGAADLRGHVIFINGVEITEVTAGTNFYDATLLLSSTNYTVTVRAVDNAGNYSTPLIGAIVTIAVAPVTALAEVSTTSTTINIDWVDSVATNIANLSVRIAITGNTPVEVELDTPANLAQAYTFITLTPSTSYDIEVIAIDDNGNVSVAATLTSSTTA